MRELLLLFLRLGFTAFGGPAAHVAMLHDEVVTRRGWLTQAEFMDLLGVTNLIPGPNSTEMMIHVGYRRAGWLGLLAAGLAFILPAMLIVLMLAWLYVEYGSLPAAAWLLYGVKPVVIVLILQALWKLAPGALKGRGLALLGLAALALYFAGINEILLLFGLALLVVALRAARRGDSPGLALLLPPLAGLAVPAALSVVAFSLPVLFFSFLKIGAVLYGGGYVLLAFVQAEFVERLGWLTQTQLLDAIAIGQVTPGPLFTTATFIGYVLGGLPGGLLATLGIFLPSFIFVALTHRWIERLRHSPLAAAFLDGVNAASLGLMAAVALQLATASFVDLPTALIGLAAAVLLFRYKVNSTWLILGGGLAGWLLSLL
ncbi:MAG: chromate efflux transporter [Anaerolineales bacterium]|nr:chromate efflux transporter [Anaerolineales bacterium]